ncbi:MAG: tRNA (adenosine(37)-N6)-dimethylallyltransferase MiaA [Candidatus Nanopelagicales bacterium]|nr:tRNA (adenosine(37)-N6)-dimethylallyltransferase MiaA [Candidatus Nanopelagicales bacterium]
MPEPTDGVLATWAREATPAARPAGERPTSDAGPWPRVVAIVGPTAAGKSALALAVARLAGAEVVNADAFQVYRGMDIGTAKPTREQRAAVPHHLLDLLDVTEELTVAEYQRRGRAVLHDLADRGVPAVVVGGSGLYLRGLLDDLRFPGSDPAVRARWQQRLDEVGPAALHAELARRDPQAAEHILASNGRRIVRALEVIELTGGPFVARLPVDGPPLVPHLSVGCAVDRTTLDERITARVDAMFAAGLVAEVRHLLTLGLREGRTASRALGYPQVIALLDGTLEEPAARQAVIDATRAYARRQQRWFRRDPRTAWVPMPSAGSSTAETIAAALSAGATTLGA